ncbi:DNA-binding transcriptional MerR regulator [Paenibacillus turicensis]|uniref:DNA-binding transcriptional MerR regulator n=1 Tax=Paenibacillus turicensis TaxID=160487 RepID=A0ABS4FR59_9BACL|nr:MerR family transcriptional regulator [Paenibacillus turicensis]MBP1904889.1 DNA-binding transcriptional MerR regulator [Paenibacillus turicensis]
MNTYTTSEVANCVGIHPNTVRLYEQLGFISKPERKQNGYRIYTDLHLQQVKLIRTGFKIEVIQNGLRKQVIAIIKCAAARNYDKAIELTLKYLGQIKREQRNAEEAIVIAEQIINGNEQQLASGTLTRKQTADYLCISIDTLRNWEMNGLLTIKRKHNGYCVYTAKDLQRLKLISSLRCANYSLSAILRMLNALSQYEHTRVNIRQVIDTPTPSDDIITVCDQLLTSLQDTEQNAHNMSLLLYEMKKFDKPSPPL